MQCRNHPERNGANTCNQCGTWLCEECTVDIQGRLYCRGCLADLSSPDTPSAPRVTHPRNISSALLVLFSFVFPPGVNYMYLGLMKRGLVAMCGFFLLMFMGITSSWPVSMIFWFAIPVVALTCLFDSLNIRRRINAGEYVPDDIGDMLGGIFRNKTVSTIVLGILAIVFLSNIIGFAFGLISRFLPFLFIGLALYVIFKRK